MPKLLQIDSCLGIYSTGRITEGIADIAIRRGWDCYIAHGARFVGNTIQHPYQITSKIDEYIHYVNSLLFDSHGLHSTSATKQLVKWIDEIKPDIINLHCIHGYHLDYQVLFEFLQTKNIPIVWTQHDCWAFTGHCSHFESIGCDKWKTGCYDCKLKGDYPRSIGSDCSRRNYQLKKKLFLSTKNLTIVSVSHWLDNIIEESFFKKLPRYVIYNGIDTETFRYRESNLKRRYNLEDKVVLLAAASTWSEAKGLNDYLELSKIISEKYKIVLVGIPDKLRKSMPKEILALPRTNNAIELAELYSMADISLNFSYQETFGLTTAEAMSCGTPGIVYNRTASPELITPETGVIVEAKDFCAIISAINEISSKGKIYYYNACRERALSNFDKYKRFAEYVDLYEEILNKNNYVIQAN